MNHKTALGISLGVLLILVSELAFALPPRVSWIPGELKPESVAPGASATYTVTLKHTGILPIPATKELKIVAEGTIAPYITITQPVFPPVFKRGDQVTLSVHVSVPTATPVSVVNGDLVLNRILPNGKVMEVWRADELLVELTFSIVPLPPDPGGVGKATLEGIDLNANGVRDDLERYIVLTHPDSEKTRAALTQFAQAAQTLLIDSEDKEKSVNHINELLGAVECITYVRWSLDDSKNVVNGLRAQVNNTEQRTLAWWKANAHFSGEFYSIRPKDEKKFSCTFNPDSIPN